MPDAKRIPVLTTQKMKTKARDEECDDASLNMSEGSVAGEHVKQSEQTEEEVRKGLAEKENRAVRGIRIAVACVLIVTIAIITFGVYWVTHENEKQDFENQYSAYADRLLDAFATGIEFKLGLVDSFASQITSEAIAKNLTFPNVSLPDFAVRANHLVVLAQAVSIMTFNLVTQDQLAGWEAYSRENLHYAFHDIVEQNSELLALQDEEFGYPPNMAIAQTAASLNRTDSGGISPVLFTWYPKENNTGPFAPIWQFAPPTPDTASFIINFDGMTFPQLDYALPHILETEKHVISYAMDYVRDEVLAEQDASEDILTQYMINGPFRYEIGEYGGTPTSSILSPMFDSFGENRRVSGFLSLTIFWGTLFQGVLPENAGGLIATLENDKNQTFSFLVDGSGVYDLWDGEHHDPTYNYLVKENDIAEYIASRDKPSNRAYTGVDLDSEFIRWKLRVYPTSDLEDAYVTPAPFVYSVIVVSIFLFTALVIVWYDWLVERRQRVVVNKAVQSGAIVSQLFPETVRDRLYKDAEEQDGGKGGRTKKNAFSSHSKGAVAGFLNNEHGQAGEVVKGSAPIADLFPHATVFFADLAGFTQWSSQRKPTEVFILLETVYAAFDAIAMKRSVFKIETIGDCYLAVTGLPHPQEDHALIMAKFAGDALLKMNELKVQLAATLGDDTMNLALRVGLHSGPVTAGVLRGQKSRFQLFGDTVNTASRMESNGTPGRIQCSQETATELIRHGKGAWLSKRKDKIFAKGKGELTTYWVSPRSIKPSVVSSTSASESLSEDTSGLRGKGTDGGIAEDHKERVSHDDLEQPLEDLVRRSVERLASSPRD